MGTYISNRINCTVLGKGQEDIRTLTTITWVGKKKKWEKDRKQSDIDKDRTSWNPNVNA